MKHVILLPTYNEEENIRAIVSSVFESYPEAYVKVVDDNSPDGTADIVKHLMKEFPQLSILERKSKDGLGAAYRAGFGEVLKDAEVTHVIMMDADFSHDPKYLRRMSGESKLFDLVVGSRYVRGGGTSGWSLRRRLLSRFGNMYARFITRAPIRDLTGGFNCISIALLKRIDLSRIASSGYAFQMELKLALVRSGASVREFPIVFSDRRRGVSKMSGRIILEGLAAPWRIMPRPKHAGIIVLALFLGLISSVPQYVAERNTPNFQGFYAGVTDDMDFYEARTKEVIDGHPYLSNPYFAEHKSGPPMQFWIPDAILAAPIGFLHVSTPEGFIFWTGVLAAALALVSYAICYLLTGSPAWSLAAVLLLHLDLFGNQFLRLAPPGLTFAFWLAAFLALFAFVRSGAGVRSGKGLLAALCFGLLFNIYPFYWTFYVIVLGIFIAGSFFLNRSGRKDFRYASYLAVSGLGLIAAIPFFIATWQSLRLPYYAETAQRLGMIATRFPSGLESVAICGITAAIWIACWRKRIIELDPAGLFLLSGVLAGIAAVNQAVVTGKNVEFSSHYLLGNEFWCAFTLLYLFVSWIRTKNERVRRELLLIACIVALIGSVFGVQRILKPQVAYNAGLVHLQTYAPVFDWLNANAPKDAVVYADDDLEDAIPIFTSQNVYSSPYGILFFMTDKEAVDRFIINHYFDNFTSDFIVKYQRFMFGGYYINVYGHDLSKNKLRKVFGLPQVAYRLVPNDVIAQVQDEAAAIQGENFNRAIHTYRVDYVVWDTAADPGWHLDRFASAGGFLTEVYSYGNFIIYKVAP